MTAVPGNQYATEEVDIMAQHRELWQPVQGMGRVGREGFTWMGCWNWHLKVG